MKSTKKLNKRGDLRGIFSTLPECIDGELNGNWKGGVHHRSDGYVLVRIGIIPREYKGARYKLLHRIVMEDFLGRKLKRSEIVHHKNGNKSDNRIENLEIMSQSKHASLHYKADKKTGRYIK